jgi:lysophospholipase L1-like esterase
MNWLLKHKLLLILLVSNILTAGALWLFVQKVGGWRYSWYRYRTNESGIQAMRREHFGNLPKPVAQAQPKKQIVMLGDSQVQNAEWQELYADSVRIYNRGISGDHIRGVQARVGGIGVLNADLIFVWVGVNDLFFGKSVAQSRVMYASLISELQLSCPQAQLVICTLAPVQSSVKEIPLDNTTIAAFNTELIALGQESQCKILDIYALLKDQNGHLRAEFTLDGVHLTHTAYALIKEQMDKLIFTDHK